MAAKEIAIKIKVDGKDVTNATKSIEDLNKELQELGERTEDNAKEFDKLKGEIDELSDAFDDTTDDVNKYTDSVAKAESRSEALNNEINDLEGQLSSLGIRTTANAEQFDELTDKLNRAKDELKENSLNAERLGENFSRIPGPIGAAAGSIEALAISGKKIKGAFDLATTGVNGFGKALIASGIGAIVVVLGLLIAGAIKAFKTFEPLQDAVGNLGTAFGTLGDVVKPLIDLIGKGLTGALNGIAKAIAWVTGNLDEYNEAVADKKATKQAIKNSEDYIKQLEKEAITAKGTAKDKLDAEITYQKDKLALEKEYQEEGKKQDESYKEQMEIIELQFKQDIQDIDDEAAEERIDKQKEAAEERIEIEKDYYNRILELQNEQQLLLAQNEKEAQEISLQQEFERQTKEIQQLKITEERKTTLLLELEKNRNLKLSKIQKDYEDKRLADRLSNLLAYSLIDAEFINNAEKRELELARIERDSALITTKTSEESALIWANYWLKIEKIDADASKRRHDELIAFETFKNDNEIARLQMHSREVNKTLNETLNQQRDIRVGLEWKVLEDIAALRKTNLKNQEVLELKNLKSLGLKKEEEARRELEIRKFYALEIIAVEQQRFDAVTALYQESRAAVDALASSIGTLAGTFQAMADTAEEGSKKQERLAKTSKILTQVQLGLAAATQTLALVEAFRGLAKDIGKGFPTNLIAVASTLALIASATAAYLSFANSFKSQSGVQSSSPGGVSGSSGPNYGKNYGDGEVGIYGPSHEQGGIPATIEGGESVINKRSTALFAPLLETMNNYGNTLKPGYANQDKPMRDAEAPVFKTYVVANDVTSHQEAIARTKDISTI